MFNSVHLIGVGLINGSLAKDLRSLKLAKSIIGIGRNQDRLKKAVDSNILDSYQTFDGLDVSEAEIIVIGVPVSKFEDTYISIKPSIPANCILTDVGSTKTNIIKAAEKVFGEYPTGLVPGHPIAGSEQNGFEHAVSNLFKNRRVILTPTSRSDDEAINKVRQMWEQVGANVDLMKPEQHDSILAATSHLPHVVAYNLVNSLGSRKDTDEVFRYAAGGFYDFTRIASSDPDMWTDICMENTDEIIKSIDGFSDNLNQLREAIQHKDVDLIKSLFIKAKQLRDKNQDNN